jgi:lysozyme
MLKQRVAAAVLALSASGAAGIVLHEGMVPVVYRDPVGIPTVCAGHTATVSQADVGKKYTPEMCAALLKQDAALAERAVKRCVTAPVTQRQYDALVSFTFNVGETAFCGSTLVKLHNQGRCQDAAAQFLRWTWAGGRQLPGLVTRRGYEAQEYRSACQTKST